MKSIFKIVSGVLLAAGIVLGLILIIGGWMQLLFALEPIQENVMLIGIICGISGGVGGVTQIILNLRGD